MSLLAKRTGLIFISALIFFSCNKEKETVGLNLNPENNGLRTFYTDTFSFKTSASLKNDSINTNDQTDSYVGAYHDAIFGDVYAESYNQILLKTESLNTSNAQVDSVVMNLHYDYHYGDTLNAQAINIYNLTSQIPATSYFTNSPAVPCGAIQDTDVQFKLKPISTRQNVKIYLTNAWGNDILNNANGLGAGTTNDIFVANFPGIAIKPKEISGSSLGAIIDYNLSDTSNIKIYYKKDGNAVAKPFVLVFNNTAGTHFSRIIGGSGADPVLSGLVNSGDEVNSNGNIYIQSGVGIRTKIEFPYLNKIKDSVGKIEINMAELIIELDPATVYPATYYAPVKYLDLIKLDSLGHNLQYLASDGKYYDQLVQAEFYDVNGNGNALTSLYNYTSNTYTLNLTSYVHGILYGKIEHNGFIIAPPDLTNRTTVHRTYTDKSKVKLKVYYTKLN